MPSRWPLAFLMNPANHQIHNKEFRGMERSYYAMPYAERYIWGATAGNPARIVRTDLSLMIRPVLTEVGIFLIPFAVYGPVPDCHPFRGDGVIFLAGASDRQSWCWDSLLLGRGQLRAAGAFFRGASPDSTYIPAHVENGKFVPGTEK